MSKNTYTKEDIEEFIEAFKAKDTNTMEDIILEYPDIVNGDYNTTNIVLILAAYAEDDILEFIIKKAKIDISNVKPYTENEDNKTEGIDKVGFGKSLGKYFTIADDNLQKQRCKTLSVLNGAIDLDTIDESGYNMLVTQIDSSNYLVIEHLIKLGADINQTVKAYGMELTMKEYAMKKWNLCFNQQEKSRIGKVISVLEDAEKNISKTQPIKK